MLLNEINYVAELATGPTTISLPLRIDVKRRAVVVVERAQPFMGMTGGAQRAIITDDVHDVVGLFNLFDQGYPIIRQKTPVPNGVTNPCEKATATLMTQDAVGLFRKNRSGGWKRSRQVRR